MATHPVHWHEGMFLRPHHFQAATRHLIEVGSRDSRWDVHYNWGLRAIDIDREALTNNRLVVRGLQARLRDGTVISVPPDGALPEIDLKAALARETTVTVLLALPSLQVGRVNVSDAAAESGRYRLDTLQLEDENTGLNPQPVAVRLLNLRLLLSTQDQTGYEVLPIARLEKGPRAEALPQLHLPYIPPVLACDAWQPLAIDILQVIYNRIGTKLDLLATQAQSRSISVGSQAPGDALIFSQLRVLNEAHALLGVMAFARGVHPLAAYLELCRLVGQLAVFGDTRRTPELPRYDHDDLGGCFHRVKNYIDALLDLFVEPDYKERPFRGAGLRMQVALEPAWLESAWQMYVGVTSPLGAEECIRLLSSEERLDMKLGSSGRVDQIYQRGQAGLKFSHAALPPRALPARPGLIYFQVDRGSQQEEWQHVRKELTLAVRLNETRVIGSIEGQDDLTVRTGGQTATLQFTLYVVREKEQGRPRLAPHPLPMHENTAKVVYPVLMHGLRLRERLDAGEAPDLAQEQAELKGRLGAGAEAGGEWAAAGGSGERSLRAPPRPAYHYALVCWLDEIFSDESPWGVRWREQTMEQALYGTRRRAFQFWEQARRAEAGGGNDDVEVFYLCVMLGYRGDLRDDPARLVSWCSAIERRLADAAAAEWPDKPPERAAPSFAPPLRGRDGLRVMLSVVTAALLLLIPVATFCAVWLFAEK